MAVIGINYDEGNEKDLKYESVSLHFNNEEKLFNSGNFVKDWWDMMKFVITVACLDKTDPYYIHSSSVNHFIMDGAPYDSAYLKMEGDKTSLIYEYEDDLMEFFVPEDTKPTWEELKEMCK
ncbi:MAG: hypothetical protein WC428_02800 [Candidatus Paceibacterota bacterium]|jgi:hypothetical protein